jgi:hypothetical protein
VFSVDVYNIRGQRLSVRQIQQQLSKVLAMSEGESGPGVGIMTAGDREPWAETYNKLMKGMNPFHRYTGSQLLKNIPMFPTISRQVNTV